MRRFRYGLVLAFLLPLAAAPSADFQTFANTAPRATASTVFLRIDGDRRITLQRVSVTTTTGDTTWHGKVKETGERAILIWSRGGHLTGILAYRGFTYSIKQTNGVVQVVPESPGKTHSSHAFGSPRKTADAFLRSKQQYDPTSPLPQVRPFTDAERRTLEAKKVTIDLMIVYTRKAASRYVISLPQLIALTVEEVNESFRNSGLGNISLRLVHTRMVDYAETLGGHFDHLYSLVDGIGPLAPIRALRDETRADIVGMIVDDPSGCGLSTRVGADAPEAYFVVHLSCALVLLSIGHEIGHIAGARHDRQMDPINEPFPYGHGYVREAKWRDIMSYEKSCNGCPRIPYWSNPRIKYKGEPTGTDANDNARVILEQAQRVSEFR